MGLKSPTHFLKTKKKWIGPIKPKYKFLERKEVGQKVQVREMDFKSIRVLEENSMGSKKHISSL